MRNVRKIAIIDPLGAHEGSFHFYTFGQAKGLISSGNKVSIYTNEKTKSSNIKELKLFNFYRNIFSSKLKILNGIRWFYGSFLSLIHARFSGCYIFHFHIFYVNILILIDLVIVKILFGKIVLTVHDVSSFDIDQRSNLFNKIVYKLANLILTHNRFSKSEIEKNYNLQACKIDIIPHGNYIPFISVNKDKICSRKKLRLPLDQKIILFFGLIKKVKGLDILLKSLKDVVVEHPDTTLLIAGKPWKNDFLYYQEIIDKHNLNDHCELHIKFIPHEDVSFYYSACDLVVLPYKKIYQSGVLMMAMSYEKPVLVSDLPPLKEVITNRKNGFVFESENTRELSLMIKEILSDLNIVEHVKNEGTKLMRTKYDWDKIGELTSKSYNNL
tara:strand:- start:553 stop:1704 length:1152 start_codon:yes stop_codon:yes gene_type:complete